MCRNYCLSVSEDTRPHLSLFVQAWRAGWVAWSFLEGGKMHSCFWFIVTSGDMKTLAALGLSPVGTLYLLSSLNSRKSRCSLSRKSTG